MDAKLTAKQKEILQVQRSLLSKNIVWNPVLAANLKAVHLLTDAMIEQIEKAKGMDGKILMLLDLMPLRTTQVYNKFADALHISGHSLVADFLREEDLSKQPLNVKDLFKQLPFMAKNMKEQEKKQIECYMSEKIQSAILAHTWQWDTKEKDKALIAKQEQLEQAHLHEHEIRKKNEQLAESQKAIKAVKQEAESAKAELKAFMDSSGRMQQQLKGQVDTQMKFSMANDNITNRIHQRLQVAEATLRAVQDKFNTVIRLTPRDKEKDLMKLADNPYFFLPEDVDLFIAQFKKLLLVQLKYDDLMEERRYIMEHLGLADIKDEESEQDSLLKAYKDFASRNDEQIQSLKEEVERYGGLLQEVSRTKEEEEKKLAAAGTVWQNAIMNVMRKQLQDLKTTLRKKETTLDIKESEITKLKTKVSDLERVVETKSQELEQALQRHVSIVEITTSHSNNVGPNTSLDCTDTDLGLVGGEPAGRPPLAASPKNRNSTSHALPPLKSIKPSSSSPRTGGGAGGGGGGAGAGGDGVIIAVAASRASRSHTHHAYSRYSHHASVGPPRGVVVESDATLTNMYPAGLTTMQLRLHRDDDPPPAVVGGGGRSHHHQPNPQVIHAGAAPPSSTAFDASRGGGGKSSGMGSTLGDLKAMHAHSKLPPPSRGGGGAGAANGGGGGLEPPQHLASKRLTSPTPRRKVASKVK